jgi:hypothetical protein
MMRWTEDQFDAWKEQQRQAWEVGGPGDIPDSPDVGRPKPLIPETRMNKTEARFAEYLEQLKHLKEIIAWEFEPIRFRLAKKTGYTPDFLAVYPDHICFYEVKGFMRDDAAVKVKTTADKYPWFAWFVVYLKKGEWVFKEV